MISTPLVNPRAPRAGVDIAEIVKLIVARRFGIHPADLESGSRRREIAWPRQVCMWIVRHQSGWTMQRIAESFNRDRGTVEHACDLVLHLAEAEKDTAAMLVELNEQVRKELES